MISLNQEQYLGKKAYMLMVSRRMTAGLVIIFLALLVFILKPGLAGFVAGLIAIGGSTGAQAVASATTLIHYAVLVGIIFGLIACIFGILIAKTEYKNYTFTFEEFDLKLKRGTMNTSIVSIPYRQMQSINLERDITHKMTGTSRVVIDSAGQEEKDDHSESEITLEPIDEAVAEEIRLMLQRKIGVQVVEGQKEADREAGILPTPQQIGQVGDKGVVS